MSDEPGRQELAWVALGRLFLVAAAVSFVVARRIRFQRLAWREAFEAGTRAAQVRARLEEDQVPTA